MYSIHHENVENLFKHLNERTQATLNEHDFIIHNKKDSHNIK